MLRAEDCLNVRVPMGEAVFGAREATRDAFCMPRGKPTLAVVRGHRRGFLYLRRKHALNELFGIESDLLARHGLRHAGWERWQALALTVASRDEPLVTAIFQADQRAGGFATHCPSFAARRNSRASAFSAIRTTSEIEMAP